MCVLLLTTLLYGHYIARHFLGTIRLRMQIESLGMALFSGVVSVQMCQGSGIVRMGDLYRQLANRRIPWVGATGSRSIPHLLQPLLLCRLYLATPVLLAPPLHMAPARHLTAGSGAHGKHQKQLLRCFQWSRLPRRHPAAPRSGGWLQRLERHRRS